MWVSRHTFLELGGFNSSLRNSEDNDFCARLHGNRVKCLRYTKSWVFIFSDHSEEQRNITSLTSLEEKLECWWSVYEFNRGYFSPFNPVRIELLERFTRRAFREGLGAFALHKFRESRLDMTIWVGFVYAGFLHLKYSKKKPLE